MDIEKAEKTIINEQLKFTKEQLLESDRFRDRKDLVSAILSDDGDYAIEFVEEQIEKYMKGQVI
jgi:hypothetical protein|nr:MAG TPA: hypothetical protein [Caudoviricetes sp.]DAR26354.1 MAG TPA: hypothetical protein [Caudoviricetes sp.]DAS41885.1 MAG TPA: hypothetical protein [Caudoviricetes sp.]